MFPLKIPHFGKYSDDPAARGSKAFEDAEPASDDDRAAVFITAEEIRRKTVKCLESGVQLSAMRAQGKIVEKEAKRQRRDTETVKLKPGSGWTHETMAACGFFAEPVDSPSLIVELLPWEVCRKRIPTVDEICKDDQNGEYIKRGDFSTDGRVSEGQTSLFLAFQKVLLPRGPKPANEAFADALMLKFLELVGVDRPRVSSVASYPQELLTFDSPNFHCSAKPELLLGIPEFKPSKQDTIAVAFTEDKSLYPDMPFRNQLAQKANESLCVMKDRHVKMGLVDSDSNVRLFGFGMRQHYLSFYLALFPVKYYTRIGEEDIGIDTFANIRFYPTSMFGLDLSDPTQRRLGVQLMMSIIHSASYKGPKD